MAMLFDVVRPMRTSHTGPEVAGSVRTASLNVMENARQVRKRVPAEGSLLREGVSGMVSDARSPVFLRWIRDEDLAGRELPTQIGRSLEALGVDRRSGGDYELSDLVCFAALRATR